MVIDLSHTIESGMPVYPGTSAPKIKDLGIYDTDGVHVLEFTINGHIGTHIDVPGHLFAGRETTSSMDVAAFFGTAQVLDCSRYGLNEIIGIEVLNQLTSSEFPDFILLYAGWSEHWGTEEYYKPFPVASENLVSALAKTRIKGVGLDTISIDPIDSHQLPNHKTILGSGKIIIENLNNLQGLIGKEFLFSCLPLKLLNGDGSPVRAVGIPN